MRTVRVDIDFEAVGEIADSGRWTQWRGYVLVPVALLARSVAHTSFTVRDESGDNLPRVGVVEEREFLLEAAYSLARTAANGAVLRTETKLAIGRLVGDMQGSLEGLKRSGDQGRQIANNVSAVESFHHISRTHYLLAPLAPSGGSRRVITYQYVTRTPRVKSERSWQPLVHGPSGSASLEADCPGAGYCSTYHLELSPPPGTVITNARLECTAANGNAQFSAIDHDNIDAQTHVWIAVGERLSRSRFTGQMRLRHDSIVKYAMVSGGFATAVLLCGAMASVLSSDYHLAALDTDSGVALLLLIPSIVGSVIAAPQANEISAELTFPTRMVLWLISLCSYGAAFLIAIGVAGTTSLILWCFAAAIAVYGEVLLVKQYWQLKSVDHWPPTITQSPEAAEGSNRHG